MGSTGQSSFCYDHGHVAYQSKGNNECRCIKAHIFPADPYPFPPPDPGQNSTFSEYGHVINQLKESRECANMAPIFFVPRPPRP